MPWTKANNLTTKASKKNKTTSSNLYYTLKAQVENLKYAEQQALVHMHWTVDDYDNADYFDLNDILRAQPVNDPASLLPGSSMSDQDLQDQHITRARFLHESGGMSLSDLHHNQVQKGGNK